MAGRVWSRALVEAAEVWGGTEDSFANVVTEFCPYGVPGDRLWVRETFVLEDTDEAPQDGRPFLDGNERGIIGPFLVPHYRATEPEPHIIPLELVDTFDDRTRWRPSRFMPRWASRITLEITNVRAQLLHWITVTDAMAAGLGPRYAYDKQMYVEQFIELWDRLNAKRGYPFDSNPWVWVIEFKRV